MLEISNVYKSFTDSEDFALTNLSLSIYEGDSIAIVSESGGGKTTLLQLINRLIDVTTGDIHIKGTSIYSESPHAVQRKVAYLSDDTILFPHMTVLENAMLPITEMGTDAEDAKRLAFEYMQLVKLDPYDIFDCYPEELTEFEKLQLLYARMLACKPEIILLDNPFKQLDRINRSTMLKTIHEVNHTLNRTILYATDDIEDAKRFTDRIVILHEGKLIQSGEYHDIAKTPQSPQVELILFNKAAE